MIPPEAPSDGLKTKERREGGRKEEARKVEISASFDSREPKGGRIRWQTSLYALCSTELIVFREHDSSYFINEK
jgi:hypothetical protein